MDAFSLLTVCQIIISDTSSITGFLFRGCFYKWEHAFLCVCVFANVIVTLLSVRETYYKIKKIINFIILYNSR